MSASTSELLNVKNFLQQQFIVTSSEWVQACIDFVKQENNHNLSLQSLKNYVYQQWLNADLEEIGVPSLPLESPTAQKLTLNGCFVLQVDGIRDVGRPAYAQLKSLELNKSSNADFNAAAPETALPPWEAKPTRMLMLNLTDGCTHVQGMEYRPLTFLSPNLSPGVKVLLQGPIDCRFGVLLLTAEKIKFLGGEVEGKLIQYSRKTILRELLQLPPEDGTEIIPVDIDPNSGTTTATPGNDNLNPAAFAPSQNTRQQNSVNFQQTARPSVAPSRTTWNNRRGNAGGLNETGSSQQNVNDGATGPTFPAGPQSVFSPGNRGGGMNDMDDFEDEDDDDFVQSLDYGVLDELEKESITHSKSGSTETPHEDVWLEDEDVVRDLWKFQDENPGFEMPFEDFPEDSPSATSTSGEQREKPFTYLSTALKTPAAEGGTLTIKGFIISVLSKLECTLDRGWGLMVRINDGTSSLDASIHDKVLEDIIGISASDMVKMQHQAAENPEKRREVMEAISKCKVTLQDYSCLMDVKFTPGLKPSIVKCYTLDHLHAQQLLERVRSSS